MKRKSYAQAIKPDIESSTLPSMALKHIEDRPSANSLEGWELKWPDANIWKNRLITILRKSGFFKYKYTKSYEYDSKLASE